MPPPRADHATPTWVKVFAVVGVLLIVAVVVLLVIGGHGPGRHA